MAHLKLLIATRGKPAGERAFEHGGEGLARLCDWLLERTGAAPREIAVAIETPHGPVVETLLERGFAVHAINPKQLARFRDRHTVAGAKDDRRDARVLADALRTDPHRFRRLAASAPALVELREWSRAAEELQAGADAALQPHPPAALAVLPPGPGPRRRRRGRLAPRPLGPRAYPGRRGAPPPRAGRAGAGRAPHPARRPERGARHPPQAGRHRRPGRGRGGCRPHPPPRGARPPGERPAARGAPQAR